MMPRPAAGRARAVLLASLGLLVVGGAVALATSVIDRRGDEEARAPGVSTSSDPPAEAGQASGPAYADRASAPADREGSGMREPAPPTAEEGGEPRAAEAEAGGAGPPVDRPDPDVTGTARGTEAEAAGSAGAAEEAGPPRGPDVAEILGRAERAYSGLASLQARFHQTIEVPLMNRRREGHGIWYQQGRDRFRMDFLEPPEDEIVADGEHLWLYYPSTNPGQVIKSSLGAEPEAGTADVLARILDQARSAYEGTYAGRERVAGVETHLVSLRPLDPRSPYRGVRVWIGTGDPLVRRFEITEANETVRAVTLTELEPNARIPEGTFHFTPPAGADVFER